MMGVNSVVPTYKETSDTIEEVFRCKLMMLLKPVIHICHLNL